MSSRNVLAILSCLATRAISNYWADVNRLEGDYVWFKAAVAF